MKNLKTITLFILALALGLTSCEKVEAELDAPVISGLEVGLNNSLSAYIGADLHIEADIVAEGKIALITVELHKEDGSDEEYEAEYTSYVDLKNATLHKHLDIPATATEGEYHFHLTVTDQEGKSTSVEAEVNIVATDDVEAPVISISSAPTASQHYHTGETITISGEITDNEALGGMLVALVYENDAIADSDVSGSNSSVIVMMHTHDFTSTTETTFTASIDVEAVMDNNMTPATIGGDNAWRDGNYYIVVKSSDASANGAISAHYPIEVHI